MLTVMDVVFRPWAKPVDQRIKKGRWNGKKSLFAAVRRVFNWP